LLPVKISSLVRCASFPRARAREIYPDNWKCTARSPAISRSPKLGYACLAASRFSINSDNGSSDGAR
jgi:hypothetical protein